MFAITIAGPDQLLLGITKVMSKSGLFDIITLARKSRGSPTPGISVWCEEGCGPAGSGSLVELLPRTETFCQLCPA